MSGEQPGGAFVREVRLNEPNCYDPASYPWSLPVVTQLLATQRRRRRGLELAPGVTYLVGDNGSGKSTLIEALAAALQLNPEGGSRDTRFTTRKTESELAVYLRLVRGGGPRERGSFFLRAETMHAVATYLDDSGSALERFGQRSLHEQSHGESFLAVLEHRLEPRGVYLLDEPEAALSPRGLLRAVDVLAATVVAGSQCVIATHSPIILSVPGARILQIGADGLVEQVSYDECDAVQITRQVLGIGEGQGDGSGHRSYPAG